MTEKNNQNNVTNIADVFAGKNGPVLGGIFGIVFLVGIHYLVTGDYKLSVKSGDNSIDIRPVSAEDSATSAEKICPEENSEGEEE